MGAGSVSGRPSPTQGSAAFVKTTLLKTVLRFYDPIAGRVALDGTDLRELNGQDHRHPSPAPRRYLIARY